MRVDRELTAQLIRRILERILGSNPVAVVAEDLLSGKHPFIPENSLPSGVKIIQSPDATYLTEVKKQQECPTKVLLLVPPLRSSHELPEELRRNYSRLGLQEVTLIQAIENSSRGQRIGAILSHRLFGSMALTDVRARLLPHLSLVVEHRHAWFGVHPAFRVYTALFENVVQANGEKVVRFFRVPEVSRHSFDEVLSDLDTLLDKNEGTTDLGYVLREGLREGDRWIFDLYSPELTKIASQFSKAGAITKLGDVANRVERGISLVRHRDALVEVDPDDQGVDGFLVLEPRQIEEGEVLWHQARYKMEDPEIPPLEVGDICWSSIHRRGDRLRVAIIPLNAPPMVASSSLLVLRKKAETSTEDWDILYEYLRSPTGERLISAYRGGSTLLTWGAISELPVPQADENLVFALSGLEEAIRALTRWRQEAVEARKSAFEFEKGRVSLLRVGERARQRVRAAELVEDPRYRIRTQYPYPIAYRWRTIEASQQDNLESYLDLLTCAETTVCYLALMTAIGVSLTGQRLGKLEELGKRVGAGRNGPGMGDWIAVLREVRDSRSLSREELPFPELFEFLSDREVDHALKRLFDRRNDQAHNRGPQGQDVKESFREARADLEALLETIEFVTDYPLRYVETTRRDTFLQVTSLSYRDLMGDHPLVPLQEGEHGYAEIEAESLYIIDRSGGYNLARPWLVRRMCPACGRPAIFHLDRFNTADDSASLKSLEHGHTLDDDEIAETFRLIGFFAD